MNNYAGSTLIGPVVKPFSHINARQSCLKGRVVSGTRNHIEMGPELGLFLLNFHSCVACMSVPKEAY